MPKMGGSSDDFDGKSDFRSVFGEVVGEIRSLAVSAAEANSALEFARIYGYLLRINECGIYEDDELEVALGRKFSDTIMAAAKAGDEPAAIEWLHVISDAYAFGGHTRLLECWLESRRGERATVLVTTSAFAEFGGRLPAGVELVAAHGNQVDRAAAVLRHGRKAKTVVLHISPEDVGAALASRLVRDGGTPVLYVNHSDHCFSFGANGASSLLEVSVFGQMISAKSRKFQRQQMLGIPLKLPSSINAATPLSLPRIRSVVSAGTWLKYEPIGDLNFPRFLNALLKRVPANVTLVGPSGTEPWWSELEPDIRPHIAFIGLLPHDALQAVIRNASCYVDSFPVTGGTLFSEALALGVPVFGPVVAVTGYSLADALRSSSIEGLVDDVARFLQSGAWPTQQIDVRNRLLEEAGEAGFARRIDQILDGEASEPLSPPPGIDITHYEAQWLRQERSRIAIPLDVGLRPRERLRLAAVLRKFKRIELRQGRRNLLRWHLLGRR